MPAPLDDLERGTVCLALYPFTLGFPLDAVVRGSEDELLAQLERHDDIEQIEKTIDRGAEPEVVTKLKLRRVLLLQHGTRPERTDVMVARVNSLREDWKESREAWYRRLKSGAHPTSVLVGDEDRHGTGGKEAYINLMTISPIGKSAILRRTGKLDEDEMRAVSERLVTTVELDISGLR